MKLLAFLIFLSAALLFAQSPGSSVYVDQKDPFAAFFSAGVTKKKVPVTLTADPQSAYRVKFSGDSNPGSLTTGIANAVMRGVYDTGASSQISMTVIESKTKNIAFSATCKKHGDNMQSVAECLAKHWKSHILGK
jgi:hypothetical protein